MITKKQLNSAGTSKKIFNKKNKKIATAKMGSNALKTEEVELSEEWYDAQDMKQLFKVSNNTLANWRKWHYFKAAKVGRNFYYNKALVQAKLVKNMK